MIRELNARAERWDQGAHEQAVKQILTTAYRQTADATYPSARAMLKVTEGRADPDEARVSWLAQVAQWVVTFASKRARQIAVQSGRIVTGALQEAARLGEGEALAAQRVRDSLGGMVGRSRSRTIARTEIGAAQNMAVSAAAEASGIVYEKVWCAAEDERTRASHTAADGQSRKEGEGFDVGGANLDRPGDPNGPPEEVINCRCTILVEPVLAPDGGVTLRSTRAPFQSAINSSWTCKPASQP
jgi:hypothetical protein